MSASPHPCMFALVSLWQILLSWAWKSLQKATVAVKLRHLLLGRKAITKLDSILKSRDITLLTKVYLAKDIVFPVVRYWCESWIITKAESQRMDAFELWCRRRLLKVPWTARRSNQSVPRKSTLNIHWKDWCWTLSSNTMATWCQQLTQWKRPWCWERM